jgi:hypothetical protein
MPGAVPSPCRVYRIVHFDNLEGVLREGGLWCGREMLQRSLPYQQIGLQDLTRDRGARAVHAGPGGSLSDYVPFYFSPRSLMLYQIYTGKVPTYQGGQEPIIYLVTSIERITSQGGAFVFSDRHAKTTVASFFDQTDDLTELDWEAIRSTDFKRRLDDPSRNERKQAEFLVHRFVPWNCILGIGVYSQKWKTDCETILANYGHSTPVKICTGWYF